MKSVNQVSLLGNLTRDPVLRHTASDTPVLSFSIATNREWFDKNTQEKKEAVDYHNIVFWGKAAEIINQFASKGKKMYITGRLQTRKWENKEGATVYTTEVVGRDFIFLTPKGKTEVAKEEVPPHKEFTGEVAEGPDGSEDVNSNDIPF